MEVGEQLGKYRIKARIGEGGMGTVFLAEHVMIGRSAAIKVLKKEFVADASLVTRFLNEARACNAIGHPGIVEVWDFGTLPGNVPFLVMEYLRGESLAQRLRRLGRLPLSMALAVVSQTAAALGTAHNKGIVHCDLKPDNLFFVADPAMPLGERVKVLDFGIAKLRKDLSAQSIKTLSCAVMGTPAYMSPEQCRGLRDQIDARTDIYALGIILYQMLCGAPPFISDGFGDTLMMHMSAPVVPPSTHDPAIPGPIEQAIQRALAKERAERFTTMDELRVALGETLLPPPGMGTAAAPVAPGFSLGLPDPYAGHPATVRIGSPPTAMLSDTPMASSPDRAAVATTRTRPRRLPLVALAGLCALGLFAMVRPRARPPQVVGGARSAALVPATRPTPPLAPAPPKTGATAGRAAAPLAQTQPRPPSAGAASGPAAPTVAAPAPPSRPATRPRAKSRLRVKQW